MPEEKEAQAKPEGKQASQVHFDDLFAKGWAEAVEPETAPAPPAKKADEDECPDCPPVGTESKDRKPIEVLKHKGKEVPVYSKKQLIDMAQQGFDYTQKRQADSEDRKKWETEFDARNKQLLEQAKRLDAMLAAAQDKVGAKPEQEKTPGQPVVTTTGDKTEEQILKEYGVDPDYITDYEKGVVLRQYKQDQEIKEVKKVAQMMLLDAVFRRVAVTIEDAQKEYPIEDVKLEDGRSATQEQVISVFQTKLSAKENQHRPIQEIARETIKEIHEFQKKAKGESAPSAPVIDEESMTPEEFAAKFPKLFAKVKGGNGSDLPPTLDRASRTPAREPVSRPKVDPRYKFKSLEEAIEAGMKDPETQKAISGG